MSYFDMKMLECLLVVVVVVFIYYSFNGFLEDEYLDVMFDEGNVFVVEYEVF